MLIAPYLQITGIENGVCLYSGFSSALILPYWTFISSNCTLISVSGNDITLLDIYIALWNNDITLLHINIMLLYIHWYYDMRHWDHTIRYWYSSIEHKYYVNGHSYQNYYVLISHYCSLISRYWKRKGNKIAKVRNFYFKILVDNL